ncbi:MAG TPA: hypothetical protein VIR58_19525 [Acidimicrobiales bacterium]
MAAESEEPTSHRGPVHATFGSPGGVVSAGCDGDGIALTSAAPAPGHRFTVVSGGPDVVEVSFAGAHTTGVRLVCLDGVPIEQQAGASAASVNDDDIATAAPAERGSGDHEPDRGHQGPFVPTWGDQRGGDRHDDEGRGGPGRDGWDEDQGDRRPGDHPSVAASSTTTEGQDQEGTDPDHDSDSEAGEPRAQESEDQASAAGDEDDLLGPGEDEQRSSDDRRRRGHWRHDERYHERYHDHHHDPDDEHHHDDSDQDDR